MHIRLGILGYLTRSVGIVIDENGTPPQSQQFSTGIDWRSYDNDASLVPKTILDALLQNYPRHGSDTKTVTTAITGYDYRFFGNRFREVLKSNTDSGTTFQLSSLSEACHAGAFLCQDGILVRCGHGSSVFIQSGRYRAITGGWGTVGIDEASATWFGHEAVSCITALHDKYAGPPRALLAREILRRLESKETAIVPADAPTLLEDLHLKRLIQGERSWKKRLYEFGIEVVDIAQSSSAEAEFALHIVDAGQETLEKLISGAFCHAGLPSTAAIDICMSGSLFRCVWYRSRLEQRLKIAFPNARIVRPQYSPVMGIALLTLQNGDGVINYDALSQFVARWGAEPWAQAIART